MARAAARSRRRRGPRTTPDTRAIVAPPGALGGRYAPLTEGEIERIHDAALTVLERTGVEVQASEAREVFADAGAEVDTATDRVRLPRGLVEETIAAAPTEVHLAGRDPRHDLVLGGTRVYMGTGGAAVKVLDLDTGAARESTLADVARFGRLADALDNTHFYLRACVARDLPNELLDVNTFYASLANTTKHVTGNCFTVESLEEVLELATTIAGGEQALRERPLVSLVTSWTVSPLRFAPETTEVLTAAVRLGVPVFLSSAPQAGATSPAALAGTLVQLHAEELSGLTYTQLLRPGAPTVLGYVPSVSDLRTGNFVGGSPEFALMNAAVAQLGRRCGVPVYNSSGLSDAKVPDVQAGYEKALTGLAAALAGSNYIHHSVGFLESLLTVAYEAYVIDDDLNGSIMRMVRGIEVTDDTLSLDVIDEVCGPDGEGHYLGTAQSLALMNTEFYYPHTADRRTREDWEADGAPDLRERARLRARELLDTHRVQPFPDGVDDRLRDRFDLQLPPELAAAR